MKMKNSPIDKSHIVENGALPGIIFKKTLFKQRFYGILALSLWINQIISENRYLNGGTDNETRRNTHKCKIVDLSSR